MQSRGPAIDGRASFSSARHPGRRRIVGERRSSARPASSSTRSSNASASAVTTCTSQTRCAADHPGTALLGPTSCEPATTAGSNRSSSWWTLASSSCSGRRPCEPCSAWVNRSIAFTARCGDATGVATWLPTTLRHACGSPISAAGCSMTSTGSGDSSNARRDERRARRGGVHLNLADRARGGRRTCDRPWSGRFVTSAAGR